MAKFFPKLVEERLDGHDAQFDDITTGTGIVYLSQYLNGVTSNEAFALALQNVKRFGKIILDTTSQFTLTANFIINKEITIEGNWSRDNDNYLMIQFDGTGLLFDYNPAFSGAVQFKNISFRGNSTNSCIRLCSSRSTIKECNFKNFDIGVHISTWNNGYNPVENYIKENFFIGNNIGLLVDGNSSAPQHQWSTDGFIKDNIFSGNKVNDIKHLSCQGWTIKGNHFYGSGNTQRQVHLEGFACRLTDNYFESSLSQLYIKCTETNQGDFHISDNYYLVMQDNVVSIQIDNANSIKNMHIDSNTMSVIGTHSNTTAIKVNNATSTNIYGQANSNGISGYTTVFDKGNNGDNFVVSGIQGTEFRTNADKFVLTQGGKNLMWALQYGNPLLGKAAEKGSIASSVDEGNAYLKVGTSDTAWAKLLTDIMNSFNYGVTGSVSLFGFTIKWGEVGSTAGGTVINFPTPFNNACYRAYPQHAVTNGSSVTPVSAFNEGKTGFTLSVNGGGSVPIKYFAIGY